MSESAPQSALAAVIEATYLAGSTDAHITEHGAVRIRIDPLRLGTLEAEVDSDAALEELMAELTAEQKDSLDRNRPQDIQGAVAASEGEEPWSYRAMLDRRGFDNQELIAVVRILPRETSFGPPFEPIEFSSPLGTNPGLSADRLIAGTLRQLEAEIESRRAQGSRE